MPAYASSAKIASAEANLGGPIALDSSLLLKQLVVALGNVTDAVGTGTVTSVSVTTANGVSATVTNPTTTPALSFTLGAITPTSVTGASLVNNTISATAPATTSAGYLGVPQNSQSAAYTTVLTDAGKQIYHPSADTTARTWTIDSNANVAYPIGTAITFINDTSAGVITIAITSDTLVLAGAGTTGSRTLAANGIATAVKITSTRWMISGTGLT